MQYAIITGESRGFGAEIAKQFIQKNVNVIGISRHQNETLKQTAEEAQIDYTHYACDLSDQAQLDNCLTDICDSIEEQDIHQLYVVNNAGMIEPVDTVGQLNPEKVSQHVAVNLVAPILITNKLIELVNRQHIHLTLINITSGAAERSVHGWSTYSSGKAGLNRFTETVALEQEKQDQNHVIFSFSPGVMDTEMQGEIRSASKDEFAEVEKFKELKEAGKLESPETVAAVLFDLLQKPDEIENGRVYKLYDLLK
ncbi:(S)-benzoin forming benzil reductase [Thalassobacillus sp. CUG 92003]|uniref:(S)-benzoin forming benzil reductase n=1 Tax=Thalassobacillus sp. CUG 92003 TaxID=2736641 RepID=UPI0015E66747|nr:(S)-benzoin forming benzil reductase [Thalassobacillus sp. CUG 92003]